MTGGYLILERPNPGLVLSTSARFYAIVKPLHQEIKPDSWAWVSQIKLDFFFFFVFVFVLFLVAIAMDPLSPSWYRIIESLVLFCGTILHQ